MTTRPPRGRLRLIDALGRVIILTNNHVIRDATSVTVTVPVTGQTYPADIVGVDVAADVAVLQIRPVAGLHGVPLGDSTTVTAGARVMSFGNQAGAGGSPAVAPGVITGTDRTIQADDGAAGFSETLYAMLATTARIEPGDSGGPLAGVGGTVIGVDTAAGTGGADTGYAHAIPINAADGRGTADHRTAAGPGHQRRGRRVPRGHRRLRHRPLPRCAAGTGTQRGRGCGQPVTDSYPAASPLAGGRYDARDPIAPAPAGALRGRKRAVARAPRRPGWPRAT